MIGPIRGASRGSSILLPFLYCVLIKDEEKKGDVRVLKICMNASVVFHLLFADDSFLFSKANEREVVVVRNFYDDYAKAFGQYINL